MSLVDMNNLLLQFLPQEIVFKILFKFGGFSPYPYMKQLKQKKKTIFKKLRVTDWLMKLGDYHYITRVETDFQVTIEDYIKFFDKDWKPGPDIFPNLPLELTGTVFSNPQNFEFNFYWFIGDRLNVDAAVEGHEIKNIKMSSIFASKIQEWENDYYQEEQRNKIEEYDEFTNEFNELLAL